MNLSNGMADAMLAGGTGYLNDGGGSAKLEIHTTAFGIKLCEFTLGAIPFEDPTAGTGDRRKVTASGLPISTTGLAAGTAATYRQRTESGAIAYEGLCGVSGSGQEAILSNLSIAVDQDVDLLSYEFYLDAVI